MKRSDFTLLSIVAILSLAACTEARYSWMKFSERNFGTHDDSLFLGLSLGMTRQAFFDTCWTLNKKQMVKEGPGNMSVQYSLADEFDHNVFMFFYPNNSDDTVYEMGVRFAYEAWAPWNKQMFADSLIHDVKSMLEQWYGGGFLEIDHEQHGKTFVKMDGHRRIFLYTKDDQYVNATFTDMDWLESRKGSKTQQ